MLFLNEHIESLASDKYAFVAYTGTVYRHGTSRWYRVFRDEWQILRYALETLGAEGTEALTNGQTAKFATTLNKNTFLRGYYAFQGQRTFKNKEAFTPGLLEAMAWPKEGHFDAAKELKSCDYVPTNAFIYIVRHTIPEGAKAYVPTSEQMRFAKIVDKLSMRPHDDALKKERLDFMERNRDHFHASDRPIKKLKIENIETWPHIVYEINYVEPSADYQCQRCKRFGHHYFDSCHLWTYEDKSLAFGAKKYGVAMKPKDTDAKAYAMLWARKTKV